MISDALPAALRAVVARWSELHPIDQAGIVAICAGAAARLGEGDAKE